MHFTHAFAIGTLMALLGAGGAGCSRSDDGQAASANASTSPTQDSTAAADTAADPAQAPSGSPGTWPSDLKLPDGMALVGTPVEGADGMTATLRCSGRGSAALTGLTAMLGDAGYKTKWVLPGSDTTRTATLEGSLGGRKVRAQINETAEGNCRDVAVAFTD